MTRRSIGALRPGYARRACAPDDRSARAHREANEIRMELHAAVRFAMSFRNGQKPFNQILIQAAGEAFHSVQHWRHDDNLAALPASVSLARLNPLATFKL